MSKQAEAEAVAVGRWGPGSLYVSVLYDGRHMKQRGRSVLRLKDTSVGVDGCRMDVEADVPWC